MNPILIAGPSVEPVTAGEMRAFLRLDDPREDELIETLIKAARHRVEATSGRVLIAQTWRIALERWPDDHIVALPLSPVIAVESLRVFDAAGVATLLTSAHYAADTVSDPPRVIVGSAAPQPARSPHGIELDLRAGYGTAADAVPAPLRHAIRMLVARWFEHRGDEPDGTTPPDVFSFIAPFRRARL